MTVPNNQVVWVSSVGATLASHHSAIRQSDIAVRASGQWTKEVIQAMAMNVWGQPSNVTARVLEYTYYFYWWRRVKQWVA